MRSTRPLTLSSLAEACGGELCAPQEISERRITHVVIDDRKVQDGSLFVPIRGQRFDGHDFIDRAFAAGAAAVLSERALSDDRTHILVSDTELALQKAARVHRDWCGPKVAAVTGSAGKTTTKEMIASVLARVFRTVRTKGNLNNQTGVPLTLFDIAPDTQAAVVEMGMNHPGEIDRIAAAAGPDIGVITNIGTAHIEYLGSREGILKAKCELLPHVSQQGRIFVNGDDDLLRTVGDSRVRTFGESPECDFRAVDIRTAGLDGTDFTLVSEAGSFDIHIPSPGRYMVYAALAAAACGLELGVSPDEIARGIASYVPAGSRMRILKDRYTILDDTYNANAPAMKAALDVLAAADGRKIAVLGEMGELGQQSERLHGEVADYALSLPIDIVIAVGEAYKDIQGSNERILWFESQDALHKVLQELVHAGDTILVKGSRATHMERTVERLAGNGQGQQRLQPADRLGEQKGKKSNV